MNESGHIASAIVTLNPGYDDTHTSTSVTVDQKKASKVK